MCATRFGFADLLLGGVNAGSKLQVGFDGQDRVWPKSEPKGYHMKITLNQIHSIATDIMAQSTRLGSVQLKVDSLRTAIETGHPAVGGVKFDTPKQSLLEKIVADVMAEYTHKLVTADSQRRVLAVNARTATRQDGTVYVLEQTRVDCGTAKPAVAWLHSLRSYVNAIRRDGESAVNAKTRKSLVAAFNALNQKDFAVLNVCDDKTGFGLVTAKKIIGNMGQAEKDAVAAFNARQADAMSKITVKTVKDTVKRTAKRTAKKHGVYTVAVTPDGTVQSGESKVKSKDAVFAHVDSAK